VSTQPNTYTRMHILHTRRTCIRHIVLCNVDHTVIYDAIPFIIINYILLSAARAAVDGLKNNNNNNNKNTKVTSYLSKCQLHTATTDCEEYSYLFAPPSSHARPMDHSRFLSINIILYASICCTYSHPLIHHCPSADVARW